MKGSKRKSCLKRTLAFVSALSIIGSFSGAIGATEMLSYNIMSAAATENSEDETAQEVTGKYSRIDIELSNQFDFVNAVDCTVSVFRVHSDDSREPVLTEKVTVGNEKNSTATISTDYLENGTYIVEVKAPGFEKFEQEISQFDNMVCTVKVSLGFNNIYAYTNEYLLDEYGDLVLEETDGTPIIYAPEGDHPGAMRVGDVNGDGSITYRDEEVLLEAIEYSVRHEGAVKATLNDGESLFSDVNYDGKTDLADLTFFTKGYLDTKEWNTKASLEKEVSEEYKKAALQNAEPAEGTQTNGVSLADLIKKPGETKNAEAAEGESETKSDPLELTPLKMVEATNEDGTPKLDENGEPVMEPAPLSEDNPVGIDLNLDGAKVKEIDFQTDAKGGYVEVELADGTYEKVYYGEGQSFTTEEDSLDEINTSFLSESNVTVSISESGQIKLDLGSQIAVKKITLKITKAKDTCLARIAEVEFLNGMEERISEPEVDFPTNVKAEQVCSVRDKDAKIVVTWDKVLNAGDKYEVEISTSPVTKADGSFASTIPGVQDRIAQKEEYSLQSEHGNFKLIKINTTYYVHVRCVGDGYYSKWSDYTKVTTVSNSLPDKPDYVSAKGAFQSIKVSWGSDNTNSTEGYNLYYRNITQNVDENGRPTDEFTKIPVGNTTSYTLIGLEDKQEYEFYVTGYNRKGEGAKSVHAQAKTTSAEPVKMRKYNAINCDEFGNIGSAHIVNVTRNGSSWTVVGNNKKDAENARIREEIEAEYQAAITKDGVTQAEKNEALKKRNEDLAANPLTAWSVVDGDQETYLKWPNWTDGGITYEFDQEYEIRNFAILAPYDGPNFFQLYGTVWDEEGNKYSFSGHCSEGKTWDVNNKMYYIKELPKVVKAKKIYLYFGNYAAACREIAYPEIIFYHYENLWDDIMNLYVDDLHTVLRDDVTQDTINELRKKISLPDERNGEYHPNKEKLERELDTAEKILNAKHISKAIDIHNSITTYDPVEKGTSRRYSGLNAWQPLGVAAGANTEITVYVGSSYPNYSTGHSTELKLIATQYNSESNGVILLNKDLKIGANTFTIPASSLAGAEGGGALYIDNRSGDQSKVYYSVRVDGGTEIPMLDIYKVTDREERLNRAADYIKALDAYVPTMEEEHNKFHKGSKYLGERNTALDLDYNEALCIAGATDILGDTMMYSLPAPQILAGLGTGTVEERAEKLICSMDAMEDMMEFFYQHKGMSYDAPEVVNRIPNRHLNIRYQRMFQGAFMYAADNHIGIQWGSAPDMVSSKGVTSDENGRYVSGSYFGWGIAHEIGHCINDGSYVVAEITNNYFSLLSQAQDKNSESRLNYNNIYKKVTSNTKGNADQGTQLGMYWQLHLAYDKDFNFKTYDTNAEILENLFFARMDTYSRNPSKAPQPYGKALELSGDTDQKLMRLACAAAEKNVLEFFERWGRTPDATTIAYASQFPKETRAIMYANEDSRVYAMNGESSLVNEDGTPAAMIEDVKVSVGTGSKANKVKLTFEISNEMKSDDILGYEIVRCTISGGDVNETPIAFTSNPYYTDTVTAYNNRTVTYKVTLIDQYLNRSEVFETEMVKIQHDGSLDKTNWTASVEASKNRYFTADVTTHAAEEDSVSCHPTVHDPIELAIDDNLDTVYEAKVTGDPSIYLNFNQSLVVSGLKYTSGTDSTDPINYFIYVADPTTSNGWRHVATGSIKGSGTVYFANSDNKYISTYETTGIRFQFTNQNGKNISIAELDVLGVTGDNVDFRRDGETATAAFGILSDDYKYGTRDQDYIPEGSLVFTGSYKGNPAYNAVILFDENGNIVGGNGVDDDGRAQQIILADVPDGSIITDVSDGTWIYWINPKDIDNMVWPEKVRVELYRVNNASTNEGQRIVSDSLFETIADKNKMPSITIGGNNDYTTESGDTN